MIGVIMQAAVISAVASMHSERNFQRSIEHLPVEEQRRALERRQDRQDAERRHRELCQTIERAGRWF